MSPPTRSFTVDTVAPDTRFTKKAPKRFFKKKVKFKFASTEAGAHFQCKLDGRAWRNCGSTFKFGVKRGKHTILVRAVDRAGNTDKTPARYKFKRLEAAPLTSEARWPGRTPPRVGSGDGGHGGCDC